MEYTESEKDSIGTKDDEEFKGEKFISRSKYVCKYQRRKTYYLNRQ